MKRLLAILLSVVMAVGISGCGKAANSGKLEFTYASDLDINNFDTTIADDGASFTAIHACVDGLMSLDKDGNLEPAIAESYKESEDRLTYTFKLRDAKWSNGDPVTADDFVYAWQRIIRDAGGYAYMVGSDGTGVLNADKLMKKQLDGEKLTQEDLDTLGIKAIDDKTLEVKLDRPCAYFIDLMAFPPNFPINRKFAEEKGSAYGKTADAVLSNGAFKLKSWELGSKAVYEKNEDYWNKDEVKLDKLTMMLQQDPKTAAANFDSNMNDFAPINSTLVDKYKDKPEFMSYTQGFLFYLLLNFKDPVIGNENIRKALSYAIDRQDITDNILKDGSKPADGFVPSNLYIVDGKDFRAEAPKYTSFDFNKAQEFLDKGLEELGKDKVTISLLYGTDESPMDQVATYLQNAFSKLKGVEIEMIATTKKDRRANKEPKGEFQVSVTRWGPDYGDATTYLNLMLDGNSNNGGKYKNPAFEKKMDEIQAAADKSERFKKAIEAEKILMDDVAVIPVLEKGAAALMRPGYKGMIISSCFPDTLSFIHKVDK